MGQEEWFNSSMTQINPLADDGFGGTPITPLGMGISLMVYRLCDVNMNNFLVLSDMK